MQAQIALVLGLGEEVERDPVGIRGRVGAEKARASAMALKSSALLKRTILTLEKPSNRKSSAANLMDRESRGSR